MTTEQVLILISIINIGLIDVVLLATFIICKIFDKTHKELEDLTDLEKEEENEQKSK